MKTVLKAKVQAIKLTGCELERTGGLTLGSDIMERLGVCEYAQVFVNAKHKDARIMTYLLRGKPGQCELNGGAIHLFKKGDIVHLLFFKQIDDDAQINPKIM